MDLRALEIFCAVAHEGSVSGAAQKVHRVQSNVSTRIKQLEGHLRKALFERHNRGLSLTADGEVLLAYADRLLQLSTEASEAMKKGVPRGVFRIGTMESTAAARLPAILSRYHALHPEVRIEIETDVARGLTRRLLNHDIEIAFIAEPVSFDRLRTRGVFEESLVLVAPQSFPPIGTPGVADPAASHALPRPPGRRRVDLCSTRSLEPPSVANCRFTSVPPAFVHRISSPCGTARGIARGAPAARLADIRLRIRPSMFKPIGELVEPRAQPHNHSDVEVHHPPLPLHFPSANF